MLYGACKDLKGGVAHRVIFIHSNTVNRFDPYEKPTAILLFTPLYDSKEHAHQSQSNRVTGGFIAPGY